MGGGAGRGVAGLIRDRYGHRAAASGAAVLLVANVGTTCAEFAGIAAASELAGVSRYARVPVAAILVSLLVVRGGFKRVEHVLLLLATVFVTYFASGAASRAPRRDRDGRHDARALGPRVHPVVRGRQAAPPQRPRARACGRDRRRR